MWLVLGKIEDELHRPDDAGRVLGDQQRTLAARHAAGDAAPERDAPSPARGDA